MDSPDDIPAPRQRKIIHIDMDAFYASVEQRDNPELRGKPVAVCGSRERGVVAAASYEARRFGVRSAMPSVTAKRQCPDLIFVKPRFEVHKTISQQIRTIFAEHTPMIEPLSLDEAYLDVTDNLQLIPLARDIALQIRARIKAETGLNASAGISYNKFLAKLASDHRKPNGQYVIAPEMGAAFVEDLPVGKFYGIGPATAARFNALGIRTGRDIRNQTLDFLEAHFGKAGTYSWLVLPQPMCSCLEPPVRENYLSLSRAIGMPRQNPSTPAPPSVADVTAAAEAHHRLVEARIDEESAAARTCGRRRPAPRHAGGRELRRPAKSCLL
nr:MULTISPECIES: DNA polymerase IV [unclassified Bradyrhizobium]